MGGNLTDEQLKEFDAYLNGVQPSITDDNAIQPSPESQPEPPTDTAKPASNYLDKIVDLHSQKAKDIMNLLDKIDAKAHKDIVADLVDEMQYQKSIVKRETEQLDKLKQLFAQAKEAAK